MYYNPYSEELKDERLELVSEELRGNTKYLLYKLHTRLINTCPKCNSNNTIKYGIRRRKIEMSLLANYKTSLFYFIIVIQILESHKSLDVFY